MALGALPMNFPATATSLGEIADTAWAFAYQQDLAPSHRPPVLSPDAMLRRSMVTAVSDPYPLPPPPGRAFGTKTHTKDWHHCTLQHSHLLLLLLLTALSQGVRFNGIVHAYGLFSRLWTHVAVPRSTACGCFGSRERSRGCECFIYINLCI